MESRLEVFVVASVMEVLWEDNVGLVNTREAALESSDNALEIPSPLEEIETSLFVFRRRSNGFIASFKSREDRSSCSVNGRSVFGLVCGDATVPWPSLRSCSSWKVGMSVSDFFRVCLIPSPRKSAGVFAC